MQTFVGAPGVTDSGGQRTGWNLIFRPTLVSGLHLQIFETKLRLGNTLRNQRMFHFKTIIVTIGLLSGVATASAQDFHYDKERVFPILFDTAIPGGTTLMIRSGNWAVFRTGGDKNNHVCAVRATWAGRGFGFISGTADPSKMLVAFAKRSWSFPDEDQLVLNYQFGDTAVAKLVGQDTSPDMVVFVLSPAAIPVFLYRMATEDFLYAQFNVQNESVWTVDLAGTGLAMTAYTACMTN